MSLGLALQALGLAYWKFSYLSLALFCRFCRLHVKYCKVYIYRSHTSVTARKHKTKASLFAYSEMSSVAHGNKVALINAAQVAIRTGAQLWLLIVLSGLLMTSLCQDKSFLWSNVSLSCFLEMKNLRMLVLYLIQEEVFFLLENEIIHTKVR